MMHRRDFVVASIGMLSSYSLPSAQEKPKMLAIVDTHQHLWDLKKIKLSWYKEDSPLAHSFTPKEYSEAIEGLNVVKSVYMEVDVVPEDQQKEADYLIELIRSKKTPTVAAVLGGHPASEQFKKYVTPFKGSKEIKGIRQVIHEDRTPPGYSLKKEFITGVQYLGEIGLSFDICIRPGELNDAAKLIDACPGTRFILDHCGNGRVNFTPQEKTQWQKDMESLGKKKNLVCKVSGIVASAAKGKWKAETLAPLVNHTIEVFGWDRVMFGGDWPVCTLAATYREWVEALKTIVQDRKLADQQKLFSENAEKFYGI